MLTRPAFSSCQELIRNEYFLEACMKDMCRCTNSSMSCLCETLSEYSHECAHAGGSPGKWKTPQLCGENRNRSVDTFKLNLSLLHVYHYLCVVRFHVRRQGSRALSTWSMMNAVVPALTPAATLSKAKCASRSA